MKKEIKQQSDWEKEFDDLPAVNYNLYIGAGKDACDNCIEFEEAKKQIKIFICRLLKEEKEKALDEKIKEIEGLKRKEEGFEGEDSDVGFNEALSQVLSILKQKR